MTDIVEAGRRLAEDLSPMFSSKAGVTKFVDEIVRLRAQVVELQAKLAETAEWRPMETAPRDRVHCVLVYVYIPGVRERVEIARFVAGMWYAGNCNYRDKELRGWLPLPAPKAPADD
jgi:hypothetical protein